MATFKQKQRTQTKQAIGIGIVLVTLISGAFYGFNQIFSGDEELLVKRDSDTNCPIDAGPSAYTAIVIDQSEGFPKNQVQQIRKMFSAWLLGKTEDILESSLDQDPSQFNKKAFDSNAMIQLYVMSKDALNTDDGLQPVMSLCRGPLPENIDYSQSIFVNTKLVNKKLNELVKKMDSEILQLLVEHEQSTSPIIETISALSASEFAVDMNKPHYLIMVSDMVQYGGKGKYSQFPKYGNFTLDYDEWKQDYQNTFGSLKNLEWQVIYLNRVDDINFEGAQTIEHQRFWEDYFTKSLYAGQGRFIVR
ncbi:hypothetical protein OAC45_03965 [Gammaproteobacteria bacterium]|jgi:hypothetical protein|nr:hypothetical protein [Gammaproteobacteria bacterium]|tara:strand:+ start:12225 stop:13139 length:915 start_codon:yes stop_codon:yes gene_type:complete